MGAKVNSRAQMHSLVPQAALAPALAPPESVSSPVQVCVDDIKGPSSLDDAVKSSSGAYDL